MLFVSILCNVVQNVVQICTAVYYIHSLLSSRLLSVSHYTECHRDYRMCESASIKLQMCCCVVGRNEWLHSEACFICRQTYTYL